MAPKLRKAAVESNAGGVHSYSASEKRGYVDYINSEMQGDQDLVGVPMDPTSDDVFTVVGKGILLAKMINKTFPATVDETKLTKKPKNMFEQNLNLDMCIAGAQAINCSTVNVGATDLADGTPHLVMGLLWQIIKRCLMHQISQSMDLQRLADADETIEKVPPEQILLRWFNYHLKNAGHTHRTVTNFSDDIADAECYAVLLSEIAPDKVTPDDLEQAFRLKDANARAELVLTWAERLGCRKFVTAADIVEGNPRLNLAFVATLFNKYPKLGPTAEELAKRRLLDTESKLDVAESLLADALLEKDQFKLDLDQTKLDLDALAAELGDLNLQLTDVTASRDSALSKVGQLEQLLSNATEEKDLLSLELNKANREKDDLFAQLEAELSNKLDLEGLLASTKQQLDETIAKSAADLFDLQSKLDNVTEEKNLLSKTLEETMMELEMSRADFKQKEEDLLAKLEAEMLEKEALNSKLNDTQRTLEETLRAKEEVEKTKEDLLELLTETMGELEKTKKQASDTEANLTAELDSERKAKEDFILKLKGRNEEYEKAFADWQEERARLLARIKELEQEMADLREDMRVRLETSEREKEDALRQARELMQHLLSQAENEKDQAIDKMRLLLTGNQKQGYLHIYMETGMLGTKKWAKRFFVLRDNLIAWYKSEKDLDKKPLGVIYAEEARLYEMEEEVVSRALCFQIKTDKQVWNISAESLEEMRSWMTEILLAKKKKMGVKVVSSETSKDRKARDAKDTALNLGGISGSSSMASPK